MTKIATALIAASMIAAPAAVAQNNGNGNGYAYGKDPKVCLITYDRAVTTGLPAENVVKAQYLPLRIAERKDTAESLIVTYGAGGYAGAGVDIARVQYNDPTVSGITTTSTTEEACNALSEYAESNDDDDMDS